MLFKFSKLKQSSSRYMDLTEDEKEKLRVSYKVAKKLDKLENFDRDRGDGSDSEDECDVIEQDYQSLDSVPSDNSLPGTGSSGGPGTFSPKSSEPPSLTESMQLMDEILSNTTMDRMARIDKLEAILSAATLLPNDQVSVVRVWFCFIVFYGWRLDRIGSDSLLIYHTDMMV